MNSLVKDGHRYKLAPLEDRCAPRISLYIPAKLRLSGCQPFSVTIIDLSLAGFRCDAATRLRTRDLCWLTISGLAAQQSEVVWNDGIQLGCAFSNLLDPAVVDHVIARWARR
jgi:PilZ domain